MHSLGQGGGGGSMFVDPLGKVVNLSANTGKVFVATCAGAERDDALDKVKALMDFIQSVSAVAPTGVRAA